MSSTISSESLQKLKDIFPQYEEEFLRENLVRCNNNLNICATLLLNHRPEEKNGSERDSSASRDSFGGADFLSSPQYHYVTEDCQKYSIGFEYSVLYNRTEEQGLDINVKTIGNRIFINEVYTNKITGLPGLSAQAGVRPGDVLVGIDYEYFNVGCPLQDVTRITKTAGSLISLQLFRYYDNTLITDAVVAARQGQDIADINSIEECQRICADLEKNLDIFDHKHNCYINNYRDLLTFRQRLLPVQEGNSRRIHHCAFLLREQDLLRVEDEDIFVDTIGRLVSRCLMWDSGKICERSRIADILFTMLTSGMFNATASTTSADSFQGTGFTLNSLRFCQPNINVLRTQLPVQFLVSHRRRVDTSGDNEHNNRPVTMRIENRRSSTGNAYRRSSVDAIAVKRSISQHQLESALTSNKSNLTDRIDHPVNASIRLLWKKALTLSTNQLRPALSFRIISIKVVDNSHFEFKIWVKDIDSGLEWFVNRRFSEFFNFRETLVSIWSIFARIPFPPRRLSISSAERIANERLPVLEQFLRSVYAIIAVQPLLHVSTRAVFCAFQDMLDVPFRKEGIEVIINQNRELFLKPNEADINDDFPRLSGVTRNSTSSGDDNTADLETIESGVESSSSARVTWRRNRKASCSPDNISLPSYSQGKKKIGQDDEISLSSQETNNLTRLRDLMKDMTTFPNDRPRRHSLFGDDPPPPHEQESMHSEGARPPIPSVDFEKSPEFVLLRSPSGNSPHGSDRKRCGSLCPQKLDEDREELTCDKSDEYSHNSNTIDRPRSFSLRNGHDISTPTHAPSYSLFLSNRLEIFIHLVLQVSTFRHIIDPFIKNFRNKVLDWELDRYKVCNFHAIL